MALLHICDDVLIDNSDNLIEVLGLKNPVTDSWMNSATVSAVVLDSTATQITGFSQPVSMPYDAGSDGDYRGVIPETAVWSVGDRITVIATAVDSGSGLNREFVAESIVIRRNK